MALASYLQKLQRILGDAAFQRYNPYDLITYVNEARSQIAGEGECIRLPATISTVANQELYGFSTMVPTPINAPVNGAVAVWSIVSTSATPALLLEGRPWEWFQLYYRTLGQTAHGPPKAWAQYSQGTSGTFYIGPIPDGIYPLVADCVFEPIALALDADSEAIPYPWTDAIPYYAAHLALRGEGAFKEADEMLTLYETYMLRARSSVTPFILPGNYPGDWRSRSASGAASVATRGSATWGLPTNNNQNRG